MNEKADTIARIRRLLDASRRRFAEQALEDATDEPTRHFAARAIDAFASLDAALQTFQYAKHESGRTGKNGGPSADLG